MIRKQLELFERDRPGIGVDRHPLETKNLSKEIHTRRVPRYKDVFASL